MSEDGLERMRREVEGSESRLQELVATSSIDFLSTSTRAYLDKCLLVSSIGVLISTLGKLDTSTSFGPFKLEIEAGWVVPSAILFSIAFYSLGLILLARADMRRWNATFYLKNSEMLSLMMKLRNTYSERFDIYNDHLSAVRTNLDLQRQLEDEGYYDNRDLPPDPVPELREHQKEVELFSASIEKLSEQVSKPVIQLRHHQRQQWVVFVALPLLFAAASIFLCINSIVRALRPANLAVQALL